ncbi:MAG TPA: hypothetical protein VGI45_32390 [Terracidiphilus sp.]|jgi:hypothetical protein
MKSNIQIRGILIVGLAFTTAALAQTTKPIANDDIIEMVKNHMAESVVISAIQSGPTKFNTSTSELIRLKKLGVTDTEMNAMIAASSKSQDGAAVAAANADNSAAPAPGEVALPVSQSRMPQVYVQQDGAMHELPLEKTQLAQTKTKPSSMKSLAGDSVVTQGLQAGVNTVAWDASTHINSPLGGSAVSQAGGIFSSVMSRRKPTVTYVWGVASPASGNVLKTVSPAFAVDFSRVPQVNSADYEPTIVKLTPAQNTCRIVGATQGKEDVRSSPAADWEVYSHFLEERVMTKNERLAAGKYKVAPTSELFPGEYAVVLRPVSTTKPFSGGDVARAQADGLMFDAIWTFRISDDAQ